MGSLQEMLDMQNKLQEKLGYNIPDLTTEERTAYIKEFSIHLNQEINEMLYELPFFKLWKDYSKMTLEEVATQIDKARGEFIDAWHFMLNIALALSFTEQDIFEAYAEKNKENYRRQDAGYTHDVSYR